MDRPTRGIEIARLRLACAVPGEQPSQFSEALRRLGENAAYLYNAGENYWFSPIASLNQEAEDRARALSGPEVEAEIIHVDPRRGAAQGHAASCACTARRTIRSASRTPTRRRSCLLPPSAWQRGRDQDTPAMKLAADIVEHKGAGPAAQPQPARIPGGRSGGARRHPERGAQEAGVGVRSCAMRVASCSFHPRRRMTPRRSSPSRRPRPSTRCGAGWKHLAAAAGATARQPERGARLRSRTRRADQPRQRPRALGPARVEEMRGRWPHRRRASACSTTISARSGSRPSRTCAVRQLRDWFAQFPYLSKLREPQVLAKAISEALARADAKYAIADRFDDARASTSA